MNYPSEKKLIHKAFENLIKLIEKDDPLTAVIIRAERTQSIKELKLIKEDYSTSELALVLRRIIESVPNEKIEYYIQKKGFNKAYTLLFDLFEQQFGSKGNKIVSIVDPEARIAHKSIGNIKKGYKNHFVTRRTRYRSGGIGGNSENSLAIAMPTRIGM